MEVRILDKKALAYSLFFAVFLGMLAVAVLPVQAADFSRYVEALEGSYTWMYVATPRTQPVEGGTAERVFYENRLVNLGGFQMRAAILLEKITSVTYIDETGNQQSTTDPTVIGQLVHLENSGETWLEWDVLRVGTLPVAKDGLGTSKMVTWNYWVAGNVVSWSRESGGLWYLP